MINRTVELRRRGILRGTEKIHKTNQTEEKGISLNIPH
jgi:hypothetical protein